MPGTTGNRRASRPRVEGAQVLPWRDWPWDRLKALVLSPGVALTHPAPHDIVLKARASNTEVIGDIELFAREIRPDAAFRGRAPVIAITGTNGKSTTTALTGHILNSCGFDAEIGGNIGKPVLELAPPGAKTIYVLEVSSISDRPVARTETRCRGSLQHHARSHRSSRIAGSLCGREGTPVATGSRRHGGDRRRRCADVGDLTTLASSRQQASAGVGGQGAGPRHLRARWRSLRFARRSREPDRRFSRRAGAFAGHAQLAERGPGLCCDKKLCARCPRRASAIEDFPGLAHRIEDVGRVGRVRFVNDSKATNADAAERALVCFPDIFWIVGGACEGRRD